MVGDDAASILHGSVTDSRRSQRGDRGVRVGSVRKIEREDAKRFGDGGRTFARWLASTTRLPASLLVNMPTTPAGVNLESYPIKIDGKTLLIN
jgi:hypothetical protein